MLERDPALAARAALALHPLFRARGPAGRHVALLHAAVGAARAANDAQLVARTLVARGEAWRHFGDLTPALRDLDEALGGSVADAGIEGEALYQRASVLWLEGRHVDASADARRALEIFRSNGDRAREGLALSLLGAIAQAVGQFAEAREHHEAALAIHRALGHRRAEGLEYNRLAHLAFRTGRTKENHSLMARALAALREAGDRMNEALCTHNLGYQLLDEGRTEEAMRNFETALGTYRELGMRRNEGAALAHLGAAHLDAGDLPTASSYFEQALFIHSSVGDRYTESFTLRHFARLWIEQGDWEEADRLVATGLEAARASANAQAEAFLLGYRAATLAMRDDLEGATELIRVARESAGRYEGMRVPEAVEILEGCIDLARARQAQARGDEETSRVLREKARARCGSPSTDSGAIRHAQRVVKLALDGDAELPAPQPEKSGTPAFVIRLSADGRKITLGEQPTVDFSRRRAQRAILHRLIAHREESPGEALSWSDLFEAGWPGERVQVEAGFGRVRTTIWALRKLGLFAVLLTRDDGYLLEPRVDIVREASGA
ncbi:MAG: tetratricopeptide repeat protein [Polyangiaceae bacterium]|nr:tetratricopeptide repeat protein [Polyangiaceae bacterium]